MESRTYWASVIKYFEANNYFRNGLTIPFILGANTILSQTQEIITVQEFLEQIGNDKFPKFIKILKCNYLGEYVISFLDYETTLAMEQNRKNGIELYKRV